MLFEGHDSDWLIGIFWLCGAVLCWWCSTGLQSRLSARHRYLDYSDHLLLTGAFMLPLLLLMSALLLIENPDIGLFHAEHSGRRYQTFWMLMLLLGAGSTLLARVLWKQVTYTMSASHLPQSSQWQSVFGVAYIYLLESRLPVGIELLALACFAIGLYLYGKSRAENTNANI